MIVYKAVFTTNSGYCKYSSVTKEIFVILLFAETHFDELI